MPELPDVTIYIEALEARILGQTLERVRLASPFLLRTINPPLAPPRQAHRHRPRRRSVAGAPPHDRRTPPLARTQCQITAQECPGRFRFLERHARAHRSRLPEKSFATGGSRGTRP